MLTITSLNAHGRGGKGSAPILAYLKATEYYRDKDGESVSASKWWGKGAESLGLLDKPVDEKFMDALARGYSPDGVALCQNAGEESKWVPQLDPDGTPRLDKNGKERGRWEGGHRVGWDLTFSAEKSFSVLFASAEQGERDRLIEAHSTAVNAALEYVERHAETRRGKGGRDVIGAKLVASQHLHMGSRDLDPQVHTHVLAFGVAQGEDGRWSTWSPEEVYRQKMTAGALYRSELAANLQKLGYGIDKRPEVDADGQETGRVYFRVAGISDEVCDSFSKRRAAILDYQKEYGVSAQTACLATRNNKDEPTYAELTKMWEETLAEMRRDNPRIFQTTEQLKGMASNVGEAEDKKLLERLHEREAVFTRGEVVGLIAQENVGRMSANEVEIEASDFLARTGVHAVAAESIHIDDKGVQLALRHREDRYAAPWMMKMEENIVERALARKDDAKVRVEKSIVDNAVKEYEQEKGFTLSAEQRKAVDFVTLGTGGTAVISGMAGTGKTATAGAWIRAIEKDGREVIGTAIGWDAAKKLEAESGIKSYSTKSLLGQLDRGKLVLTKQSVVFLDEAGMAGSSTVHALQKHIDEAGGKLILGGDSLQLQAVDAGSPFRLAVSAVGETKLTEIRRQQGQSDKSTAEAFYAADGTLRSRAENRTLGQGILSHLQKNGQIEAYASQSDALQGLVDDHLASPTPDREKLVIGGTRSDVQMLNLAIREGLKGQGKLGNAEETFLARDRGTICDLTLSVGDRIRFNKKDRDMDVVNGNVGVVEGVRRDSDGNLKIAIRLESEVKSDEGRRVVVDTEKYRHLGYGYASTVHKAQGQGKAEVRQLANLGMTDRQLALVGFTRMKQSFQLYGADEEVAPDTLAERLGTDRLKQNALEAKKVGQKPVSNPVTRKARQRIQDTDSKANTHSIFRRAAQAWKAVIKRFEKHRVVDVEQTVRHEKPTHKISRRM